MDDTDVEPRRCRGGIEPKCFLVALNRLGITLQFRERGSLVEVGSGCIRSRIHRQLELFQRLLVESLLEEGGSTIEWNARPDGSRSNLSKPAIGNHWKRISSGTHLDHRFIGSADIAQCQAVWIANPGGPRRQSESLLEVGHRLLCVATLKCQTTESSEGLGAKWIDIEHLLEVCDGDGFQSLLPLQFRQGSQCWEMIRLLSQYRLVVGDRILGVAKAPLDARQQVFPASLPGRILDGEPVQRARHQQQVIAVVGDGHVADHLGTLLGSGVVGNRLQTRVLLAQMNGDILLQSHQGWGRRPSRWSAAARDQHEAQ